MSQRLPCGPSGSAGYPHFS